MWFIPLLFRIAMLSAIPIACARRFRLPSGNVVGRTGPSVVPRRPRNLHGASDLQSHRPRRGGLSVQHCCRIVSAPVFASRGAGRGWHRPTERKRGERSYVSLPNTNGTGQTGTDACRIPRPLPRACLFPREFATHRNVLPWEEREGKTPPIHPLTCQLGRSKSRVPEKSQPPAKMSGHHVGYHVLMVVVVVVVGGR